MIASVDVIISSDGEYIVTLDNWGQVGYGEDVVAFYNKLILFRNLFKTFIAVFFLLQF